MEAKDLRIGNWFEGDNGDKIYYRITAKQILDFYDDPLDDYYKPIPLTEDWLLDFGFIIQMFGIPPRFYNGKLKITKDYRGFWVQPCYNFVLIKYVHQLQNLYFELTGEELTLKN